MAKKTKADIIKKIIDIDPENPGSISEQYITKRNGKKLGPYFLWQSSRGAQKISIRVPKNEIDEIEDYIKKMKDKNRIQVKKTSKLLDTYMDTIADISPGHVAPINKTSEKK